MRLFSRIMKISLLAIKECHTTEIQAAGTIQIKHTSGSRHKTCLASGLVNFIHIYSFFFPFLPFSPSFFKNFLGSSPSVSGCSFWYFSCIIHDCFKCIRGIHIDLSSSCFVPLLSNLIASISVEQNISTQRTKGMQIGCPDEKTKARKQKELGETAYDCSGVICVHMVFLK